jgi:hypothetical protein
MIGRGSAEGLGAAVMTKVRRTWNRHEEGTGVWKGGLQRHIVQTRMAEDTIGEAQAEVKADTAHTQNAQILAGPEAMIERTIEERLGKTTQNIREGSMETIAQEIDRVQESGDEAVCQVFSSMEQMQREEGHELAGTTRGGGTSCPRFGP